MKMSYTVKFHMNRQYEMHAMTFEITEEDLTDEVRKLPVDKRIMTMQRALLHQGVAAQMAKGYLTGSEAKKELKAMRDFYVKVLGDNGQGKT